MSRSLPVKTLLALSILFWAAAARADDPPAVVGGLSYTEGTVSFHAAGQTEWAFAAVNYPVTTGESFWTQPDGRAEIQIGSAAVRLDNGTEMDVLRLDATTTQLQLDQGTLNYRLVSLAPGQAVEIETPHGAVSLTQPGTYHIEAGTDTEPTLVATLEGEARFIGPHSYLDIGAGEQATAIGDPAQYTMAPAVTTPFDDWALQRDEREQPHAAVQYVSPAMTGAQDLDHYGTWQASPQYGEVWVPASVPAEWAPYRAGHWAWVEPWGWTWIDNQPWGFAPFHYGRWAEVDQRWAWVPGAIEPRPVYAPALVAFIGGAPGAGIALNIAGVAASIGWLPLAPNEVYVPPYHPSLGYIRNLNAGPVNRTVINQINNNYLTRNRTVNNYANAPAATIVPQQAFVNAQPVQAAALHTDPHQFQNSRINGNLAALQPTAAARAAARPAATTSAAAPGPTVEQQHAENAAIEHATPPSLATTGKEAGQPTGERAPATPPVSPEQRPASGAVEHAPADHAAERPAPATATPVERPVEQAAARPAEHPVEARAAEEKPRAPAPGPAIRAISAPQAPLRQQQLAAALAKPAPKAAARPPAAVAKAQPAPAARPAAQPVAFHPAAVAHPQQAAPLRPTPQGWHREGAKPGDDKKDGEK
jgi:hypothetical protein